ncbi:broad-complex core protein isoforms 1/2/3/4/5-like isoform X2 [Eriocheir sinensis]|nr:broad-complex core protein isoforms 1/2/3/4/5-like isoform X2 [Eriocheir sinensis]
MSEQCYCLRWNNYQSSVVGVLRSLLEEGQFVDVTLACDGRRLKAHKLMLSACSNFFRELLKENPSDHPIVFLRDVRFWELESIMDFIYNGQVNVMQDQLPGFIRTAEALQIKGLAAVNNNNNNIHAKPPDPRLFCGEGGRLPEHYYLGGGAEIGGELHHPPPLKRPRRPPPSTHTLLPPRPENPSSVSKLDDLPSKAAMAPTTPAQGSPKTPATTSDPSRSDPVTATAAPGTTPLSASTPSGVTTSPRGTSVGDRPSSLVKWEEDRTSTPTDAESDSEFGASEGTGIGGVDGSKDGDWVMGESQAPLSLNLNYSDGGFPVCKVCGKVFKHQGSLVAHYQVHQLRTKCPVCKKVLSRHYHMKVHLLTVHKVPDAEIEGLLRSQNIA